MRRPPACPPRRPNSALRRPPRTRTEAAVELVKVEFKRDRLRRELEAMKRRAGLSAAELRAHALRAQRLLARLATPEEDPWP
ncbi:hypothetical protein [Alloyangia pacifica]|uniref:hypothetical protein n=1 Tax=Alloyangia pacifica TaxID=311180 RepID=UPI00131EEB40|nr:hypothetical protein [Alloyangia pacifica]